MAQVHLKNEKNKGLSFYTKYKNLEYGFSGGNLESQPYFIASSTKLMTIALILNAVYENRIRLEDKVIDYLDASIHPLRISHNNIDYTADITIKHCLMHSSGIPDYFLLKNKSGQSVFEQLQQSQDRYFTNQDKLILSSQLKSPFPPNDRKSHYSDTNFTILGIIIEQLYGIPFAKVVEKIITTPLELKNTYIYTDPNDQNPVPVNYKSSIMNVPKSMSSFGANGGAVSTSEELHQFLWAFWNNVFFPREMILDHKHDNRLFYPFKIGLGIQTFELPRLFTLFQKVPMMMGHAGINGTMAFYMPTEEFYFSGTINNAAYPNKIFQIAIQTYLQFKKEAK